MINIKNIASVLVAISLSILLVVASFSGGHSDAYFFPRIITSIMLFLSLLLLIQHFYEKNHPIKKINIAKLTPFFILIIIFISVGRKFRILFMCILNVLNNMLLLLSRKKRYEKNSFFSFNWYCIHDGNIFSIYFFIKSTSTKIFFILKLICSHSISYN